MGTRWPVATSPSVLAALLTLIVLPGAPASPLTAQAPGEDVQIAGALQAAPVAEREGATVLGFLPDGSVTTLRQGSGLLVCLADDAGQEGWSAACYHESLEPFMARGRELRAEGVTDAGELAQRRWDEADAGTLPMPEEPAMLYALTGDDYDPGTGTVVNGSIRWVIYTPWATPESTGLTAQPTAPGAPWLMFPGTAGAHIMITPPPTGGR